MKPDPIQPVRPNAQRMQDMVHYSILSKEKQIVALEAKDVLTESHRQSVTSMCISKMLETMCSEFKTYHSVIMASLETNEAMRQEQVFFDENQGRPWNFCRPFMGHPGNTPAEHSCSIFNEWSFIVWLIDS